MAADLREYVVTAPIEGALMAFLEGYAESRTATTDRIGVWISGFFGAGKSHFAKMLGYLLENRAVGGQTARELSRHGWPAVRIGRRSRGCCIGRGCWTAG